MLPQTTAMASMGTLGAGTPFDIDETLLAALAARSAAIEAYLIHVGSNYSNADCLLTRRAEGRE